MKHYGISDKSEDKNGEGPNSKYRKLEGSLHWGWYKNLDEKYCFLFDIFVIGKLKKRNFGKKFDLSEK